MQLLRAGLAMNDDGTPVMSDAEFDRRFAELDKLEPDQEKPE
jgi:NAD-dependent DNA ligase